MPLAPGTRLGSYEIVAPIGAGGMGEVYRAHDTKLNRDVAIKVLLPAVANDPDRLARFSREAQVLASLNHPNIAHIHGLEDADGVKALVLELVEGEDLAQRIARGPIPLDEAVPIARQIAEALEAAHEQGIIHRDLKPANIKVRPDGTVKVLDFGLAKALAPDAASGAAQAMAMSPTLSVHATYAGVILGTAAYMSPEQARGKPVDRRTDIWAFGCVLFEMLTGTQTFDAGDTVSDAVAAILKNDPDWAALPADTPPHIRTLLRRCLQKDLQRRLPHIGVARIEIDEGPSEMPPAMGQPSAISARRPLWRRVLPIAALAAAAAAGALAFGVIARWTVKPGQMPTVTRFPVAIPEDQQLVRVNWLLLAVSPDGTRFIYGANRQLYMRAMSDTETRPIPGTNSDPTSPFFSPDGRWIGFHSGTDKALKKIAVTGGAALTLCKADVVYGASWAGDQIVFAEPGKGILRVSANGGAPEVIAAAPEAQATFGPQLLDEGRAVLFTLTTEPGPDRWDTAQIVVQRLGSADRKVVVRGGAAGQYVSTGHLVYALGSTLLAVPFDVKRFETRGGPIPIVEQVARVQSPVTQSGAAQAAVSASGSLVYLPGGMAGASVPRLLALVDRDGKTQPIGVGPQTYLHPRLSPNGGQIAVATDDGRDANIWVYDLKGGGSLRRLTFGGRNLFPIWTPDGRAITFQSDREGDRAIYRQPADGSGAAERLTKPEQGVSHEPESWRPDGKVLSLDVITANNQGVWTVSFDGDPKPRLFADTPLIVEKHSVFSPDGRWVAYMSNTTISNSSSEVLVQPFPPTGATYQISTNGGRTPLWSRDGRQLFYHEPGANRIFVVDVRTAPGFTFGRPTQLPVQGTIHPISQRNYDVTPDGQLLVVVPAGQGEAHRPNQQFNVVLNWTEELKQRVPIK